MDQGLEENLKTIKPVQIIISKHSLSILEQATFLKMGAINLLLKNVFIFLLTKHSFHIYPLLPSL